MMPVEMTSGVADELDPPADLAAQLSLYQLIVDNVTDIIVVGDAARRRIYVSPSTRDVLGYEPAELIGGSAFELVHPEDRAEAQVTLARLGPMHPVQSLTFRMRRKDGRYIWIEGRYRHIAGDGGVLTVLRDVTRRKDAEEQLAEANAKLAAANAALEALVHRDGLTGLANRRCFDLRLEQEFRRARRRALPLGLVLLDVDCFKLFNDCYGHLAGDDCLRRVSSAVEGGLRRPGDLAARYGGEEIAVLLPATDPPGSALVAEAIRAAVAALEIEHRGSAYGIVTVSAGSCSILPSGMEQPADLIVDADRALYRAKQAGRNQVRAA